MDKRKLISNIKYLYNKMFRYLGIVLWIIIIYEFILRDLFIK